VRWSIYSFALECYIGIAVVDRGVDYGDLLTIDHPNGQTQAEVVRVPFVDAAS
jgi:glycine cleavage system aminomethyltransferase T